ncbi:MAG: DUF167 domain-containing protein [Actinomycetes bacterium]
MRFTVRVRPAAGRTHVGGRWGPDGAPALLVVVAAPAADGRANQAVVDALARAFGVRRSAVRLVSGSSGRTKLVEVDGVEPAALDALMRGGPSG